ncbi:MAG: hypothetical protein FJW20_26645 [Acidimicrobiia bacterium]|nr:hypothetical protein [Acidimicrobiia bacterium]
MKALEFHSTVTPEGQIPLPPEIASQIPSGEQLRVLLIWEPSDLDPAWRDSGRRRFEDAISPGDDIYELPRSALPLSCSTPPIAIS